MLVEKIWFENERIFIKTDSGKIASHSLSAFPRLLNSTQEQRENFETSYFGIHWPELDEDLSFEGFFSSQDVKEENEISVILKRFPEINVNRLAKRIGINQSLLAKYVCGNKRPSQKRIKEIENALHQLGRELSSISL
ncbi:MAG: DUF2442 domain-containing protein [Bacteroidales bacterium]|nr:DUF2442 domain-containing protein [Bacteroidales bacterium]MDD2281405.1 DUF2442 domain-containing protein [Bacteroidales bacterium]